jgi:hypothetical protein
MFAWESPTSGQRIKITDEPRKNQILEKISGSPDIVQSFIDHADTPLSITQAKGKVISGADFTSLVGKTTDLREIASLPTVHLVNTSDKSISGFMLGFTNPTTNRMRIITFHKLSVKSGHPYVVSPEALVTSPRVTVTDDNGAREVVRSKMESEKYWITLGNPSDYFISVGKVSFEDGTEWIVNDEGGNQ